MAKILMNLSSKPELYIMIPPPLYLDNTIHMQIRIINIWLPIIIREISFELGLKPSNLINLFDPLGGRNLSTP